MELKQRAAALEAIALAVAHSHPIDRSGAIVLAGQLAGAAEDHLPPLAELAGALQKWGRGGGRGTGTGGTGGSEEMAAQPWVELTTPLAVIPAGAQAQIAKLTIAEQELGQGRPPAELGEQAIGSSGTQV